MSELEEKIDSMLLPIGFDKAMTPDTIYYSKGICKFVLFKFRKVRKSYFYYVKLYSENCAIEDIIYLIASNNRQYYLYKNFSLDEILNILTTCKDVNKLDMYMLNRENLKMNYLIYLRHVKLRLKLIRIYRFIIRIQSLILISCLILHGK